MKHRSSIPLSARSVVAALVAVALAAGACATPSSGSRSDPWPPGGAVSEGSRPVEAPDTTQPFREELREAPSPAARLEVAKRAVETALAADQPTEAARWLIEARALEKDPAARGTLDARALALIDESVPPIGVRTLLEGTKPRAFPHEQLLFKLALLQIHANERAAGRATLGEYLELYPSGGFAQRARERLVWLDRLGRVEQRTIGVLLPLTGSKAAFGKLARQALELALEGSGLRAVVKDTRDDEAATSAAVEALVLEEGAIALLGPIFRTEARAAAIAAQRLGVPLLTISQADDLPAYGTWVFRNGVTNRAQAAAVVAHAMDVLKIRTFAILHPRMPYGEELRDLFWDAVAARGGEIRGVESYATDATTFSMPVRRLVGRARPDQRVANADCSDQPDAYRRARCREQAQKNVAPRVDFEGLFIPDQARTIRMVAAALAVEDVIVEKDPRRLAVIERTMGRRPDVVTLLGASGWNSDKITDSTGRTVENAIFTDGFFAQSEDERTARFVRTYRERYDRVPALYPEALIYDSARILRTVVEERAPADRAALREGLRTLEGFPGVTGETSFAGGTDARKSLKILTINDGAIVEVPPSGTPRAEAASPEGAGAAAP